MRVLTQSGFILVYLNRLHAVREILSSLGALHNRDLEEGDRKVTTGDLDIAAEQCAVSFQGVGEYALKRALEDS